MRLSAILAPLLDAKADHELIRQQILAYEAEVVDALERRRANDAERQARRRERMNNVMSRDVTVTERDTPHSPPSPPPTPPSSSTPLPPKESPPKGGPKKTPRGELETVLSPERAAAVVEHRQRIGKPMTAHGAALLARQFARCPDPDTGADAMIANGWQGFQPEWMERLNARAGPAPPPRAPSQADVFAMIARKARDDRQERDDSAGSRPALPHLSAVGPGR